MKKSVEIKKLEDYIYEETNKYNNILKLNHLNFSVKDFGAIGDGISRKISEVFPDVILEEIKVIDSNATLEDEADWYAIMSCLLYARKTKASITIPKGIYVISKPIILVKYDKIFGNGSDSVIIKSSITTDEAVIKVTQQEVYLRGLKIIYGNTENRFKYNAIELCTTNSIFQDIVIFDAFKAFFTTSGCYNNHFDDIFIYNCVNGLLTSKDYVFNANIFIFRAIGGQNREIGKWQEQSIGICINGSTNQILGGELAGFNTGTELSKGANNKLSYWTEDCTIGLKNTSMTVNNISGGHFNTISDIGKNLLITENGIGTCSVFKPLGQRSRNISKNLISNITFDKLVDDNFFDYSLNNNYLKSNSYISINQWDSLFGDKCSITVKPSFRHLIMPNLKIDLTKPLTIFSNIIADTSYMSDIAILYFDSGEILRIIGLDAGYRIEKKSQGIVSNVCNVAGTDTTQNPESNFIMFTLDFPNNRILVNDIIQGKVLEFKYNFLSVITENICTIYFMHNNSSNEEKTFKANSLMIWDRIVPLDEFYYLCENGFEYIPLNFLRNILLSQDNIDINKR